MTQRLLRSSHFTETLKVATSVLQVISALEAQPPKLSKSAQLASIESLRRESASMTAFNAQMVVPRIEKARKFAFFVVKAPLLVKIVQLAAALVTSAHGKRLLILANARPATITQSLPHNNRLRRKIWTVVLL